MPSAYLSYYFSLIATAWFDNVLPCLFDSLRLPKFPFLGSGQMRFATIVVRYGGVPLWEDDVANLVRKPVTRDLSYWFYTILLQGSYL